MEQAAAAAARKQILTRHAGHSAGVDRHLMDTDLRRRLLTMGRDIQNLRLVISIRLWCTKTTCLF